MLKYHMTAFFLGFLLDLLLGDPYWLPHPIRLIGNLIAALDRKVKEMIVENFIEELCWLYWCFLA